MQVHRDRKGKITFSLTKHERRQLDGACGTVELLAKALDGEPLGDAALKATDALVLVLSLVGEKVEAGT